jgi:amino-acid N-acetyltransferase
MEEDQINTVRWFRDAAPYINQHRKKTFVVYFSGAAIASEGFDNLVHDLAILQALGIHLVLVYGARPQIDTRTALEDITPEYADGLRITTTEALDAVIEAVGRLRVIVEARLSLSLANTPMSGSRIRVCSGNFITARPLGVRDGIDYQHTGKVRKVQAEAIQQQLDNGQCVLLSPLGYSPTGEVFNMSAEEVATQTAIALQAHKLIFLNDAPLPDTLPAQLTPGEIDSLLLGEAIPATLAPHLRNARHAIESQVQRCHVIDRGIDGGLLLELFTRDGAGILVSAEAYEGMRKATINDVGGILELISPLEQQGLLVRRSREQLELEIGQFTVIERDGMIIACAALYPYPQEQAAEIACVAVHPEYRQDRRGERLIEYLEKQARLMHLKYLFVLSTQTMHWFMEQGYLPASLDKLPLERAALYNYQRLSKIFIKSL